jgi:hypothetical protein
MTNPEENAKKERISIEKIAIRMLQENIDIELVKSVSGLSTEDVLKLQNKL